MLTGAGGVLAFENALPTSVSLNLKNGEKDVPTYSRLVFIFSRPVALSAVQSALSITPATDGALADASSQKQYTWSPAKPLTDLTDYIVTLSPLTDLSHHRIPGGRWTFTTNIIPRIMSVTGGGTALSDGLEIDPGTPLTVNFNDVMDPSTIKLTIGKQPVDLKWAADNRSGTISTQGMASGPLVLKMGPGGRDQSGHYVPGTFTLKTGIY